MDRKEFTFDLLTQRFIAKRWGTPLGKEVRQKIIESIEQSGDLREVLEPYVLQHPANVDPYNYPYYPVDAMENKDFWVLNRHDLRGIFFEEKNLSGSTAFAKMSLNYVSFRRCNLSNNSFKKCDFSYAKIENCNLMASVLEDSSGIVTSFAGSNLADSSLVGVKLASVNLLGCDLRGVHFENTVFSDIELNYLTKFDKNLHLRWSKTNASMRQLPDLYRAIRVAYEKANLQSTADYYLVLERTAYRKHVLWQDLKQNKKGRQFFLWFRDFVGCKLSGYGTSPFRTFWYGFLISLVYAIIYTIAGVPAELYNKHEAFLSAIYLSFTTFSTLGYGDLVYDQSRNVMRLVCTSEAWVGAIFIAFFVVIFTRRILR